jgi:hypothetical protein
MLIRGLIFCCIFFLTTSACVEPYQFVVENREPALVVEGLLTDASYQETVKYPSDGRYFFVKLSYAHDVTNQKSETVSGAKVSLISSGGEEWRYTEQEPGTYLLLDKAFKAKNEEAYKLNIVLENEDAFESDWQSLPGGEKHPIGAISFDEIYRDEYEMIAGEKLVRPTQGIAVKIDLPPNPTDEPVYYRWDFDPTWIYIVPLLPPINKKCWVRSKTYLYNYTLHRDNIGGYKREMFFVETYRNNRFYEDFSLLIRQLVINKEYHQFLEEVQLQSQGNINDTPPYNIITNLKPVNNNNKVVGFFAMAKETATRWYFNRWDLSYFVENTLKKDCSQKDLPPGPDCYDCLAYPFGDAFLERPSWWVDKKDRR